jgi:hypothetical protein
VRRQMDGQGGRYVRSEGDRNAMIQYLCDTRIISRY